MELCGIDLLAVGPTGTLWAPLLIYSIALWPRRLLTLTVWKNNRLSAAWQLLRLALIRKIADASQTVFSFLLFFFKQVSDRCQSLLAPPCVTHTHKLCRCLTAVGCDSTVPRCADMIDSHGGYMRSRSANSNGISRLELVRRCMCVCVCDVVRAWAVVLQSVHSITQTLLGEIDLFLLGYFLFFSRSRKFTYFRCETDCVNISLQSSKLIRSSCTKHVVTSK